MISDKKGLNLDHVKYTGVEPISNWGFSMF